MKRGTVKRILFLFVFICLACSSEERPVVPGDPPVHILFVGNSYTYYNSLPQMVGAMARHAFPGRRIETKFVGSGGATLKQLWKTGKALTEIKTGNWEYVVLQEQSMLGTAVVENGKRYFGSPQTFFSYAQKFAWVIKSHGAEPVFFMTWSRQEHPDQQKYLTYAYMHIAKELRSKVAPAGMVWDRIRRDSTINLYQKDGSHPTVYGSYLAAATLFATIFDTRPTGLPGRLEGHQILRGGRLSPEKSLLCNLNAKETGVIQNAVAGIFEKMQNNNGYLEVQKAVSDKRRCCPISSPYSLRHRDKPLFYWSLPSSFWPPKASGNLEC